MDNFLKVLPNFMVHHIIIFNFSLLQSACSTNVNRKHEILVIPKFCLSGYYQIILLLYRFLNVFLVCFLPSESLNAFHNGYTMYKTKSVSVKAKNNYHEM